MTLEGGGGKIVGGYSQFPVAPRRSSLENDYGLGVTVGINQSELRNSTSSN